LIFSDLALRISCAITYFINTQQ